MKLTDGCTMRSNEKTKDSALLPFTGLRGPARALAIQHMVQDDHSTAELSSLLVQAMTAMRSSPAGGARALIVLKFHTAMPTATASSCGRGCSSAVSATESELTTIGYWRSAKGDQFNLPLCDHRVDTASSASIELDHVW